MRGDTNFKLKVPTRVALLLISILCLGIIRFIILVVLNELKGCCIARHWGLTTVYLRLLYDIAIFFYFSLQQGQGHHNSVSQLLWARSTYPTLSTFPVGGNRSIRRKPTTFGRALTLLFSHEDWVRIHLTGDRTRNLRGVRRVA